MTRIRIAVAAALLAVSMTAGAVSVHHAAPSHTTLAAGGVAQPDGFVPCCD
jgi:hypothetical protein